MGYRLYMSLKPSIKHAMIVGKPFNSWRDDEFKEILTNFGYDPTQDGLVTKECIFSAFHAHANTDIDWLSEYIYELMYGYLIMCDKHKREALVPDFNGKKPDHVYIYWC